MRTPIIHNKQTRQTIAFVHTGKYNHGALLEMVSTYNPNSTEPKPHYHPVQQEHFTVISGTLCVRKNGTVVRLHKGEALTIAPGEVHSMWNESGEKTVANWKVTPALHTEDFFRTLTGLSNDGKTDSSGIPGILQMSLTASRFNREIRLASPPYFILAVLFFILKPIARLKGYRPTYKQYLE